MSDPSFADDTTLSAGVKDMEHHLSTERGKPKDLSPNTERKKNKLMTNIDTAENLQLDRTEIEKMTNYTYMGNTTAMNNRTRQELSIRIKAGWSFLKNREKSLWTGTLP